MIDLFKQLNYDFYHDTGISNGFFSVRNVPRLSDIMREILRKYEKILAPVFPFLCVRIIVFFEYKKTLFDKHSDSVQCRRWNLSK